MLLSISISDRTKTYCVRAYHSSFDGSVFQSLEFPLLNDAKIFYKRLIKCINIFDDDDEHHDFYSWLLCNNKLALDYQSDITIYRDLKFTMPEKSHRVIESKIFKEVWTWKINYI